jgi:hypothetical protein
MTLVEMLRANGSWEADAAVTAIQVRDRRIEKLEAALREIAYTEPEDKYWPGRIARKALEGKDD